MSQELDRKKTYEEMLNALEFVDRLYSTIGGVINPAQYGLIANSLECGPMINAVRDAIRKARGFITITHGAPPGVAPAPWRNEKP